MPAYINMETFSDILEVPYVQRDWRSFNLGGGYGSSFKKNMHGSKDTFGRTINVYMNMNMSARLKWIKKDKDEWNKVTSFYYGVLVFCYHKIKHKINYLPMSARKQNVKIRKCMVNLEFPDWAEDLLEEVWDRKYDFNEYLDFLVDVPGLNFDVNSAKLIYRLQGDDAILGILGQIYTDTGRIKKQIIQLIPNLSINWLPKVDDFVSGCFFPVVVTKYSDKFRWVENDNGIFLVDEFDHAIDCIKSGSYTCAFDPLFNRLGYCYGYGNVGQYRICWTWGEIVECVGQFKGDVIVRNLGEDLFNYDWHRFGVNGKLCVYCFNGKVGGKLCRTGNNLLNRPYIRSLIDESDCKIACDLMGNFVDYENRENVVFSNDELMDWFELGELCVDQLI